MSGAKAGRTTDRELDKGRIETSKVKRYWPGRAPEWAEQQAQQDAADDAPSVRERTRTEIAAPVVVKRAAADDPRMQRLAQRHIDPDEALEQRRAIRAAEIVRRRREDDEDEPRPGSRDGSVEPSGAVGTKGGEAGARQEQGEDEEEDEEEALRRRQAVRERLMQQQREQEAAAAAQQKDEVQEEEEEEEEEESEYETDSDDGGGYTGRRLLKPVFVPKESRETIAEREALEREEEEAAAREKARLEERKAETQQLVRERVAEEEAQAKAGSTAQLVGLEDIDTDDEADPVGEYEEWKKRELRRIQRSREEKERLEKEAQERERLKSMTEEERRAWEAANPKVAKPDTKQKWKFMQKYWHKGAYFQEAPDDARGTVGGDAIFQRDYSGPTGEDLFNKEAMPKVMQVRNFGRAGRTKWTHLLDEDTTARDDPLAPVLADSSRKRSTGTAEEFAKPKKFKFGAL